MGFLFNSDNSGYSGIVGANTNILNKIQIFKTATRYSVQVFRFEIRVSDFMPSVSPSPYTNLEIVCVLRRLSFEAQEQGIHCRAGYILPLLEGARILDRLGVLGSLQVCEEAKKFERPRDRLLCEDLP